MFDNNGRCTTHAHSLEGHSESPDCAMYMLQEMLISLFKAAGFTCDDYRLHERQIENRRQRVVMHRRWVQAIFTYKPETVDPLLQLPVVGPLQAGGPPVTVGPPPVWDPPQAAGPPLQAQVSAQPVAPPAHLEEDSQPNAGPAAMSLPDQAPSPQDSSNTSQHSIASGDQAMPSFQQAAATEHQPAWQQQAAAFQHQQPLSPDAALLASASRLPKRGCVAQPVDKQQPFNSQQGPKGAFGLSSTSDGLSSTTDPFAHRLQEAGMASVSSSAAQRQEWEEGGTSPDQEPITGCLFADSTLEEVLLGSCLAIHVHVQPMAVDGLVL